MYCFILVPAAEPVADIKEDTSEVADNNEDLDKGTGNVALLYITVDFNLKVTNMFQTSF